MRIRTIRILWITDGRTGHVNKVKGFLACLKLRLGPHEIVQWKADWRIPGLRHVMSRLSGSGLLPPPTLLLKNFPPAGRFDLVISSGGLTQWVNTVIAQRLGIPNVYLGSLRQFSQDAFTLVPMVDPPHDQPPFLKLDLIPSDISPESILAARREYFADFVGTGWLLLLGGPGEGLKWSEKSLLALVERFTKEAAVAGKQALISTSRRTPVAVENVLRELQETRQRFYHGAWFHATSGKTIPLAALLGVSGRTFVTADSVSMTHEAVAAGVPVIAIYPAKFAPGKRHESQFGALENRGRLARMGVKDSLEFAQAAPGGGWQLITENSHADLADRVMGRLGMI